MHAHEGGIPQGSKQLRVHCDAAYLRMLVGLCYDLALPVDQDAS